MPGRRQGSSRESGGLLTLLLVGALLLCHGVFGFAHEISCYESASSDLLAHASPAGHEHAPSGNETGEAPVVGHAFAGYFGIVLLLFGVAMLGLRSGAWGWHRTASRWIYGLRPLPTLARLPRGPTLPLLQVFRL